MEYKQEYGGYSGYFTVLDIKWWLEMGHMRIVFNLGLKSRPMLLREIFVHTMSINLNWKRLTAKR